MMAPRRQYTVAWICALSSEMVAARSMLDEEYDDPGHHQPDLDDNVYTFGRIAGHNVVITCCRPYMPTSVAIAATAMLRTFPDVRFSLLVGIGSGVPSETDDIRLGDVVVNMPQRSFGGVIQLDIGKQHQGQFKITGSLSPPPIILLNAVIALEAEYEISGRKVARNMLSVFERHSGLEAKYGFPGRAHDRLFQSHYDHVERSPQCSNCDDDQLVLRPPRMPDEPMVHHGLVATSHLVIRDGKIRDYLTKTYGIICFEVEAAGLMSDFPCLLIRGIADYADSHKSTFWQGYAAMTAASYAKDLLWAVPRYNVYASITAADVLDLDLNTIGPLAPAPELFDSVSQSSTVVGDLEPSLVEATAHEISRALASDRRLKTLFSAALLRMTQPVFQRHVITALNVLSKSLQKFARVPLERAMAWMLRHYKSRIASQISELVSPEGHDAEDLKLSLDQVPSAQQQQLVRFINERFPVAEQSSSEVRTPLDKDADNELPEDEEQEEEEEDYSPPDVEVLTDLSQVEQILCSGVAFEELLKQLKSALFPPPSDLIKKVLRRHISPDNQRNSITCVIEWHVLEYIREEGITIGDLDYIFTLTGEFNCACAVRLGDYMSGVWSTGKKLMDVVKTSLAEFLTGLTKSSEDESTSTKEHQIKIHWFAITASSKEQAFVKVSGSFDQISESLEQLAWLAATLRPHIEGQLTVSDIDFRVRETVGDLSEPTYDPPTFYLSLFNQDNVLRTKSDELGHCWTSLFTESVLAYGFPLAGNVRPDGALGLEVPFEIITAFVGVKFPILLGDRIALASNSSVLIPETTIGDSIQWHFIKANDWLERVSMGKKPLDPQLSALDLTRLVSSRAFLGYWKSSEVLLGTSNFEDVDIVESGVPRTGPKMVVTLEGPLNVGVSGQGYATAKIGTNWKFNRGEVALIQAQTLSPDERFKRAAKNSALLYDQEACVAFLVSELSVILQMVCVYLRNFSKLRTSKMPFAAISADGGEAAFEAIKKAKEMMVPLEIGPPRKFVDIVLDFLTITEQRKAQVSSRRQYAEVSLKVGLRGWDYADVQAKSYEIWERELRTNFLESRPIWWKLFKGSGTLILFARMTRFPIRNANSGIGSAPFNCGAWEKIPRGQHLFLANMAQLQQLRRKSCQNAHKYPTRYMLTNKLAWARPTHSRLFEQTCQEGFSCNPLQTMCKVGFKREKLRNLPRVWQKVTAYHQHPGDIEPSGAALFAEDPSDFKHRRCRRLLLQSLQKSYLKLLFISLGLLGFVLAYATSRVLSLLQRKTMRSDDDTRRYLDPPVLI